MTRLSATSVLAVATLSAGLLTAQTPGKVDFRRDIQPIFHEKCIGCHGPSQQNAGMRLDRRSSAMESRGSIRLGPGNAAGSRLYLRISGNQYGTRMPPTGPLDPAQIELIKKWIDQGAEWPDDLAGERVVSPPDPRAVRIMEPLRNGDIEAFTRLLRKDPEAANRKGPGGTTPLIESGADPNVANDAGATPLMWVVDNEEKTRFLLEHGANPNTTSIDGRTPLAIALSNRGSAPVVKLLFDHGAKEPKSFSGAGGDEALLKLLIARGIDPALLSTGLNAAAAANCSACIDMLLKSASKSTLNDALIMRAARGDAPMVKTLLERGADAKFVVPTLGFTALMSAAALEQPQPDLVKSLLEHGADVDAETREGMNALRVASRQGNTAIPELLRKAGAKEGASPEPNWKPKPAASARAALDRTIPLLQRNDVDFFRKSGCVSCHNNSLTAMTVAAARKQGLPVDEGTARSQLKAIADAVEDNRERVLQGLYSNGGADAAGYVLLGLAAENWSADPATDALARYVKSFQWADGAWHGFESSESRPPIKSSDIQRTATAMRDLQVYMPKAQRAEYDKAIEKAAEWLVQAHPVTTEDRAFQLLGFAWAGGRQEIARKAHRPQSAAQNNSETLPQPPRGACPLCASSLKAAQDLLREQRPDGGWAQTATLASDAYATGQALVGLKESGVLSPSDPAYKRGAQFLMNTQFEDGSWYVRSRAIGFQPYFESGFPFGRDQFISAAATNWAAMALVPLAR
jgi:ankyrin repeat protein